MKVAILLYYKVCRIVVCETVCMRALRVCMCMCVSVAESSVTETGLWRSGDCLPEAAGIQVGSRESQMDWELG